MRHLIARERERETEALATAIAPCLTHAPLLRFGSAVARWQVEHRYGELKGEGGAGRQHGLKSDSIWIAFVAQMCT